MGAAGLARRSSPVGPVGPAAVRPLAPAGVIPRVSQWLWSSAAIDSREKRTKGQLQRSFSREHSCTVAFPRWGPRISDQRDPEPWERLLEVLEIVAPER